MKIKMKTPGRNGKESFKAGAVIDVSGGEAKALVARGVAEYAGKKPTEQDEGPGENGQNAMMGMGGMGNAGGAGGD